MPSEVGSHNLAHCKQVDKQVDKQVNKPVDKQVDKQVDNQVDKPVDKQVDKWAQVQMYLHTRWFTLIGVGSKGSGRIRCRLNAHFS